MEKGLVAAEKIQSVIFLIRGMRVMLDADLARLYGVETKILKRAVNRNRDRFPADFMFLLEPQEVTNLRCQFGTSSSREWGGRRYRPMAFTEQGVAMLSGILKSKQAVQVNIAVMRAFVRLRETLVAHREFAHKLAELERKIASHDESIQTLFEAIRQLMNPPELPPKPIGFHVRERRPHYGKQHK